MKTQWDIIMEDLADTNSRSIAQETVAATPPAAPKKPRKRKSLVGAPGDDVQGEAGTSGKKKKKEETLTLHKCLALTEADVKKLSTTQKDAMKTLYTNFFNSLYMWGRKPLKKVSGELIRVHHNYLHLAPTPGVVYRGIQDDRLEAITNKALIAPDYESELRVITVLPLMLGPYGPHNVVKYYEEKPPDSVFQDPKTHYYIIGGQHTVTAFKNLLEKNQIREDKHLASTFNIVPVWAKPSKHTDLMHFSRALNQNLVGEQKEQNFTKQLLNARIKWRSMGSPLPALMGRVHSAEYNVSCLTYTP